MQTGLNTIRKRLRGDRRSLRIRVIIAIVILLALAVLYMCVMGEGYPVLSPLEVGRNLWTFVRIKFAQIFNTGHYDELQSAAAAMPYYAWTVSRFKNLLLMMASGAILSLSGTVYQTSMRNPMAVPTMLGVSSGVNLAQMILVLVYAESVYSVSSARYILNYAVAIGSVLCILLLSRLVGGKRFSVADMLIVGTVFNQVFRIIMNYIRSNMDEDTLYIYQEYAQNSQDYFQSFADLGMLALVSVVILLPLFLMRFAFNAVSFEDEETRSIGVRAGVMRIYGIVAGAVLTTTAMIHAGNIGMLSMIIPLMCRYIYGADFRTLMGSSALWGAIVLVVSNLARGFTYLGDYQIPLGNIISLLAIPLLIWIMWTRRSAWSTTEN